VYVCHVSGGLTVLYVRGPTSEINHPTPPFIGRCTMPLIVGEPPSAILIDDEGSQSTPLPAWTLSRQLEPPTTSLKTRLEVFDAVDTSDHFEAFSNAGGDYTPRKSLCCGICHQLLVEPAACDFPRCTFLACSGCWKKHYATGRTNCPVCRREQPLPIAANHLLPILDEELEKNGIEFLCNTLPPGSSPRALWCCNKTFGSSRELREHLRQGGPFRQTRDRLIRLLMLSLDGNKEAQAQIYEDPDKRKQLTDVLEEDAVCMRIATVRSMMAASGAAPARSRSRSRSRSVRRGLRAAPWRRAPPTP
jgi:hypothetical protein